MNVIFNESCLNVSRNLEPKSVNTIVTSPPYYGLRDYGVEGQIGVEQTPQEYVDKLVSVFRACREVLRDDGTLWLNLGDTYSADRWSSGTGQAMNGGKDLHRSIAPKKNSGLPDKNLIGIPWRVAFALQADGWYLRQDIIWHKPNPMPESVKDRCTKAHEYIFLLSKSPKYYFDADAIREPHKRLWDETNGGNMADVGHKKCGKIENNNSHPKGYPMPNPKGANKRDVWTVATKACKEAHFAIFPPELIRPCILAGAPKHGVVLDPFMGAGTTAMVCKQEHRQHVGFELNPAYIEIAKKRIASIPDELDFKTDLPNMRS